MPKPFVPINAPALPSTIDKSQVSSSPNADGAENFISFVEPSGFGREKMCSREKQNFLPPFPESFPSLMLSLHHLSAPEHEANGRSDAI